MDLSKAFDTLDHSLLLAKLSAYGFDNNLLSFVRSYLTNRIQKCKIENHFSNWREITTGVPQGSILGPLFLNIFINDIFLFAESWNICNNADDNTLFAFGKTFDEVTRKLQNDFLILDGFSTTSLCWILTNVIFWLLKHLILYPTLNVKISQSRAVPPKNS